MITKGKEAGRVLLSRNRRAFRIYDMPVELINWYISYAKLHCDNQVWKVLKLGKDLIEKKELDIQKKVAELEKRVELLEGMIGKKEDERTFGGDKNG